MFDPAYFTETIGVGITPVKDLKERLGATMKQTLSADFAYADDKETADEIEDFKQEYGLSSITDYQAAVMENILFTTRLDVFMNFKGWDEVDALWENRLTAKINKWVNVNFEYTHLYDLDLSDSYQSRKALSVGISFLSL